MGDVLTVAEYATATTALRVLRSELVLSDLAATKTALARLLTAQGQVDRRRRANINASRLVETARMAERMAGLARLNRESLESEAVGRRRLVEATAEMYGTAVADVKHHKKAGRGRPRTTRHGLTMYRHGCKCDICRAAKSVSNRGNP